MARLVRGVSMIRRALSAAGPMAVAAYALAAAFTAYFSMYAFRKPFAVATYADVAWEFTVGFKTVMILSQVFGYALSKLLGVVVVSGAPAHRRALLILALIGAAELALLGFAVVPAPVAPVAMFLNGLSLGMIWGLVFATLEGRRTSEVLGTGLCTSFIVASGAVKSVGSWLMVDHGVPERWMPAATGALFFPLLALSVVLLAQTPPPDAQDVAERMERVPMTAADRRAFVSATGFGLGLVVLAFVALTALRDFRDNFAVEIWSAIGYPDAPQVFTVSELPAAVVVLVLLAGTVVIRNNRRAVLVIHGLMIAGAVAVAAATAAFQAGWISAVWWMILLGAGIYVGYVPGTSILADRLTAAVRLPANAAYFMYLLDACGYAGSVLLLLFKELGAAQLNWLPFFVGLCYAVAGLAAVTTFGSLLSLDRSIAAANGRV